MSLVRYSMMARMTVNLIWLVNTKYILVAVYNQ
jgi:hypothetical protein